MGTNLEKMMYFYIIHGWNSTLVCYPGNLATVKLFQQISNVAILSPCSLVAEDVKITSRDHARFTSGALIFRLLLTFLLIPCLGFREQLSEREQTTDRQAIVFLPSKTPGFREAAFLTFPLIERGNT